MRGLCDGAVLALAATPTMLDACHIPLLADFDFGTVREYLFRPIIREAAWRTLQISILAQVLGIALGVGAAVSRNLRIPVFSQFSSLYVWFFRGTPLLLQIVFVYAGLPLLAPDDFGVGPFQYKQDWLRFSPFQAALIGLAFNEGAYMAEIVRAGIESIARGQMEASKSLGMTNLQGMRHVILPQAMRVVVPPTGNEFIAMLKNSSLASVISYEELLFTAGSVYARNFQVLELLTVAAIWYLFFTSVFSVIQGEIEARLRPDQGRRGVLARLARGFNQPIDWSGRMLGSGDRR